VYDLVILLWPTQALADPRSEGFFPEVLPVIWLNVAIFAVLGVLAAATVRWRVAYVALVLLTCTGTAWWAMVLAGYDWRFVNWVAYAVACMIYGLAFAVGAVVSRRL
jgi:hypothetical protein